MPASGLARQVQAGPLVALNPDDGARFDVIGKTSDEEAFR
jgi:hypothetical protein